MSQNRTEPDKTGQDRTAKTGQDRTKMDKTGQYQTKPDRTGQEIVDEFHNWWRFTYRSDKMTFMGVPIFKTPMDCWLMSELIWSLMPGLIIETGTHTGGSGLFFATLLQTFGCEGEVLSIDVKERPKQPSHPKLNYLVSDCLSDVAVDTARVAAKHAPGPVIVYLDSAHHKSHVLAELELYHEMVSIDSYLIVEDTDMAGHPMRDKPGFWTKDNPGPWEAVQEFIAENDQFKIDRSFHKFGLTVCRDGFLKRVA
jgi:cephalosporin hydroxylase